MPNFILLLMAGLVLGAVLDAACRGIVAAVRYLRREGRFPG